MLESLLKLKPKDKIFNKKKASLRKRPEAFKALNLMTINVSYFAYTNTIKPSRAHKMKRQNTNNQEKGSQFSQCFEYYKEAKSFLDFHKNWSESSEDKHAVFCRAARVKIACENVKTKSKKLYCSHAYKTWRASIHEKGLNFH